jgi:nucleoid-associated protein YgaU
VLCITLVLFHFPAADKQKLEEETEVKRAEHKKQQTELAAQRKAEREAAAAKAAEEAAAAAKAAEEQAAADKAAAEQAAAAEGAAGEQAAAATEQEEVSICLCLRSYVWLCFAIGGASISGAGCGWRAGSSSNRARGGELLLGNISKATADMASRDSESSAYRSQCYMHGCL